MSAAAFAIDPDDPRAPTEEQWAAMTAAERARVIAALPTDMPWELHPAEGDSHRESKESACDSLGAHFRRQGAQGLQGVRWTSRRAG